MMKRQLPLAILAAVALLATDLTAALNLAFTIVPSSNPAVGVTNVDGVLGDAADGYDFGSLAHNGLTGTVGKSQFAIDPSAVFGRVVTVGDIESMSFATKKANDHVSEPADWYLVAYTKPFAGDFGPWYGSRIGTDNYLAKNLNELVGDWNYWSTDTGDNQMRWFESTAGAPGASFGSYVDPDWTAFKAGYSLGTLVPLASQEFLYIGLETASSVPAGFNGQVDGLRIQLTDGSVATFNFEPHLVPANRDACKKNGWMTLLRPDASPFGNQGDCVSFVSAGK